jgi:hypothetical protein
MVDKDDIEKLLKAVHHYYPVGMPQMLNNYQGYEELTI